MTKNSELKLCTYPRNAKPCAACHNGFCIALRDTDFGDKKCPFYMDKETKKKKMDECRNRLFSSGFIIRYTKYNV